MTEYLSQREVYTTWMGHPVFHLQSLRHRALPVLRLRVHGGVPVGVVEDDGVRAGEVDADAARARREDEDEVLLAPVEPLHQRLTLLHTRRTVQPEWKREDYRVARKNVLTALVV